MSGKSTAFVCATLARLAQAVRTARPILQKKYFLGFAVCIIYLKKFPCTVDSGAGTEFRSLR